MSKKSQGTDLFSLPPAASFAFRPIKGLSCFTDSFLKTKKQKMFLTKIFFYLETAERRMHFPNCLHVLLDFYLSLPFPSIFKHFMMDGVLFHQNDAISCAVSNMQLCMHKCYIISQWAACTHIYATELGLWLPLLLTQWICNYHLFVFCNRIITSNSTPRVRIHSLCENSIFLLNTKNF